MDWNEIWYSNKKSPIQFALKPLSYLTSGVVALRRKAYSFGWLKQYTASTPVIVIGNITVGGTGKTPFIIWLGQLLTRNGIRVGVVSRGYGAQSGEFPRVVDDGSSTQFVGDEPYLIYSHLKCPVVIDPERSRGVQLLESNDQVDVILSDDGMQHYKMARDIEIAIIDGKRGLGNGSLLPLGPLREPEARLQEVDYCVSNSVPYEDAHVMQLHLASVLDVKTQEKLADLKDLKEKQVHAVAGIGHPQRFFDALRQLGIIVIPHEFPDHHNFSESDLDFGDSIPVLMTEKDAVKCRQFTSDTLWYAPVNVELPLTFENQLIQHIQALINGYSTT